MTTEEKAKAYDEAIERAKGAHNSAKSDKENGVTDKITEYTIQLTETIFPELKESGDERIRKEIVDFICWATDRGCITKEQREKSNSWLAWLEKQGEKVEPIEGFNSEFERQISQFIASIINKEYEYTEAFVKWTSDAFLNYAKRELEKQAGRKSSWSEEEEKNIRELERLVKQVWAIAEHENNKDTIHKMSDLLFFLKTLKPQLKQDEQKPVVDTKVIIPKFRVGDIVKSKSQPMLSPRKIISIGKDCYWCEDRGCIGFALEDDCEIVEQKPTDKVEPKFKVGDVIRLKGSAAEYTIKRVTDTTYYTDGWSCSIERCEEDYELVEQKSVWSEEDEMRFNNIFTLLEELPLSQNWFKSLKDRVLPQPKQEWSEEDKKIIDRIESEFLALHRGDYKNIDFNDVSSLTVLNWVRKIKSLRFQNTWKPSDEQVECLHDAVEHYQTNGYPASKLNELYEQMSKIYKL